MAEIEKVIEDLESIKRTLYNLTGSHRNERKVYNAIRTIRELQEDCNRYHEWGMHEGYEEAKDQIPKWHLVADGDLPTECDWYLAMFQDQYTGFIGLPYIADYLNGNRTKFTTADGWIIKNCTDREDASAEYYKSLRCVSWMELPKFEEVE